VASTIDTDALKPDERAALAPFFSELDGPVFALTGMPEVVKGALFARYSRSDKSLRRLFLDEFAGDLDLAGDLSYDASVGVARAEQLYEKVFLEYGDDSVAQLGGVHLACEQSSNLLTKILERGRLMSYLEQSTRYIAYDQPMEMGDGESGYRYYRSDDLGPRFPAAMDEIFSIYSASLEPTIAWFRQRLAEGD
jgi:thymidylate synthase ThyX